MEKRRALINALISKLLRYSLVLFIILSLNFFLPRLLPGDPVMNLLGLEASYAPPEVIESLEADLGLDRPLPAQYWHYLGDVFTGDWGYSFEQRRPVFEAVMVHLRWTVILALPAILLGALVAAVLGAVAGWRRRSPLDVGLSGAFLAFYSIPPFLLAMFALWVFGFKLGWFPLGKVHSGNTAGLAYLADVIWHMALPLAVLTVSKASYDFLVVRNAVVATIGENFILTARGKGLSELAVLFRHALPNALAPLVTVTAIQLGVIFAGTALIEIVFSWPGMGTLIYGAIGARDYPLIQYAFFIIAASMLLANFVADIVYAWLDPRIR